MAKKLPSLFFIITLVLASATFGQSMQTEYFSDRIIIKYESDQKLQQIRSKIGHDPKSAVQQYLHQYGIQQSRPLLSPRAQQIVKTQNVSGTRNVLRIQEIIFSNNIDPAQLASKLNRMPGVTYAEPKYIRYMNEEPNDEKYQQSQQENFNYHNFPNAWDLSKGSSDIIIAIVDGGVDYMHPELNENLWVNQDEIPPIVFSQADQNGDGEVTPPEALTYLQDNGTDYNSDGEITLEDALHEDSDFTDNTDTDNNDFTDDLFGWDFWESGSSIQNITQDNNPIHDATDHGTHVAGIAAAETNNGEGIAGAAYNATYMPIKAGGAPGFDDAIGFGYEGILYAAGNGADIINCSWSGGSASQAEEDIIELATQMGALVVAAAGNEATRTGYPARYDKSLAVGSVEPDDNKATYSNFGYNLDVLATGTDILSTSYNNNYISKTGTSMSTPVVSGLAALVKDVNPSWDPERIGMQIRGSASYIDKTNSSFEHQLGHGAINAYEALNTNLPGMKIVSQEFLNSNGNKLALGEEGTIELQITNVANDTPALQVELESINESDVQLSNTNQQLGNFAKGDTVDLSFPVTIPTNFDLTEMPTFRLEFIDQNMDYNNFNAFIYEDMFFEAIAGNNVKTSFGAEGTWGFSDPLAGRGGVGFIPRYPDGTGGFDEGDNLLFEGGLMMTFNSQLFDAVRTANGGVSRDFLPEDAVTVLPIENGLRGSTQFTTLNDSTRRAKVELETFAYDDPAISNVVFAKYTITNPSDFLVMEDMYVGLFNDWDIGNNSGNNNIAFNESDSLLYISDAASSSTQPVVAVAHLGPLASALAIDNTIEGQQDSVTFGIYDGFTDNEKEASLTARTVRTNIQNTDVSAVTSSGPYTLNPGAKITVGFIYAFGDDLNELRTQIAEARTRNLFAVSPAGRATSEEIPQQTELFQNYPNPFNEKTEVRFNLSQDSHIRITIFDVLGRKVRQLANTNFKAGEHYLPFDAPNLSSGVYFIQLETDQGSQTIPITKIKAL
ncbi:S8/S53 family peptidase [Fodinibius sp. Rm-B-1B1-1]|uniref:S8/S53 family peptidase n=1 Tax=Fodinibius alkaliphilus TaxID=3140241 RepID=UPI00315AAAB2